MKLCVSAIAWGDDDEDVALALLNKASVHFVEHVPGRISSPEEKLGSLNTFNITPHAFQALLFGTNGLSIFGSETERCALLSHLGEISKMAGLMGVKALVFGSPKNRWIDTTQMTKAMAWDIAVEFFKEAGRIARINRTCLCIEPNPPIYNCNFLTNTIEVIGFLEQAGSEGLALNLDTGALITNQEDAAKTVALALPYIGHVHLSEPGLAPLALSSSVTLHEQIARSLKNANYSGIVSIEMARVVGAAWGPALDSAIAFARRVYAAT